MYKKDIKIQKLLGTSILVRQNYEHERTDILKMRTTKIYINKDPRLLLLLQHRY